MKQNNRTLIWVIVGVLGFGILTTVGVLGFVFFARAQSVSAAKDVGEEVLSKVARPWSAAAMLGMVDPYSANPLTQEKADKLVKAYEKEFGSLVSIKGEINDLTSLQDVGGAFDAAEYIGEGIFEKSPAMVMMILIRRNGKWYLESVSIVGPNTPKGGYVQ